MASKHLMWTFLLLSLFVACGGGGGKKSDADTVGNDGILTDEDLLTDEIFSDEDEIEPGDEDATDVKPDTVDKDITDTKPDTEEEPDVEIVTNPCDPNPCLTIEHSDGNCTVENVTFVCGCKEHYLWDGDTDACVAETRRTDCTNIPVNGHGIGENADGKFEQMWDGDSWEPATFQCTWACNEGYLPNEEGDACVGQQVIYVKWDATGTNDGTSWENAFTDLTTALEVAVAGQEIWVAAGTYVPSKCLTTAQETCNERPRNRTFTLPSGVAIYGGFAGTETSRNERNWETNETILSGDLNGDDTWDDINKVWLNMGENAYHVIQVIADMGLFTEDALLDGFTITHGYANDPLGIDNKGAGLDARDNEDSAEITLRNCIFTDNIAEGTYSGGGGASFANMNPIIENCSFENNRADFGAGALSVSSGNATVISTTFMKNVTAGIGGAIWMSNGGSLNISYSDFTANKAGTNGSAIASYDSDLTLFGGYFEGNSVFGSGSGDGGAVVVKSGVFTISHCTFYQNSSSISASAIAVSSSTITADHLTFVENTSSTSGDQIKTFDVSNSTLSFSDAAFTDNIGTAVSLQNSQSLIERVTFTGNHGGNGGAISCGGTGSLTVTACRFKNNAADQSGSGFIGIGGALFLNGMSEVPTVNITNSVFDGNHANLWGGAMAFLMVSPTTVNCTLDNNTANVGGPGIIFVASNANINNSIIWDAVNQVTSAGPYNFPPSNPIFRYSDVFGSGGSSSWILSFGTDSGGNIDEDPLFVGGTGSDPLYLQETSPCVDTGSNALVPEGITTDILGFGRFNDTVDMGAYERWK